MSNSPGDFQEHENLIRKMSLSGAFSSEISHQTENSICYDACETEGPWNIIIVNQIPMNIDQEKFISVFSKYGNIEDTYMCHPEKRRERKDERMARLTFSSEDDAWRVWEASQKKLIKYDDQVLMITLATDDYSPIQNLPDICLREIFLHVHSIKDKLLLEMVCKRWKENGRCCWSNITRIGTDNWNPRTWGMILSRVQNSLKKVELNLNERKVQCLGAVAERCVCLEQLNCELCYMRDTPCAPYIHAILQNNRNLRRLRFHYDGFCDMVMNMEHFPAELEEIDLFLIGRSICPLTVPLSNFQNLRVLRLRGFDMSDHELIDDVVTLEQLSLIRCEMPEAIFSKILRNNRGLKYLHLAMDDMSEASFMHVQRLPNLQVFMVKSDQLTDAYLGQMTKLKGLNLCSCHSVTDEGIRNLFRSVTDITRVCIADCSITLEATVIAREWTARTGKPVKLSVDDNLFKKYEASDWENTELFQVVEWHPKEINDALRAGGWALELLV